MSSKEVAGINTQLLSKIICSINPWKNGWVQPLREKKSPYMIGWMAQTDPPREASKV